MKATIAKIKNNLRLAAGIAAIAFCCHHATAQAGGEDEVARPVLSMFTADVGHTSLKDTYLTPVTYGGTPLRLGYEHMQALGHDPEHWVRRLELALEYDNVHNPVGSRTMHGLFAQGEWSLMHRWRDVFTPGLQLMGGGAAMLHGGAIYNPANSNNVASVKIHLGIGLAGCAAYPLHFKRLPVTLSYHMTMPLAGAFYSPDYDESYYEIYVGNHSGLVHAAWPGSRLEMNNLVSADLHLGNTILRLGYRHHWLRSSINNLTTRQSTHSLVIGIGGNILSVGNKPRPTRTITAF